MNRGSITRRLRRVGALTGAVTALTAIVAALPGQAASTGTPGSSSSRASASAGSSHDPNGSSPPAGAPGQQGTTPDPQPQDGASHPATPAPAAATRVAATPAAGHVTVTLPGGTSEPLSATLKLPSGTVVDARAGAVELPSPDGTHPGVFSGGEFVVGQTAGAHPLTRVRLTGGDFADCPRSGAASAAIAAFRAPAASRARHRPLGRHAVVRQLWGRDHHGRFATSGRFASAEVRGTVWLTQDRCDGTRIAVRQGAVLVRDTARHRTVVVRAGHSYLVRAPH